MANLFERFLGSIRDEAVEGTKKVADDLGLAGTTPADLRRMTNDLRGVRRRIEAENARNEPMVVTDKERERYPVIKEQNYVKGVKEVINDGELWVVRFLDDSELTVMNGGGLRVVNSALNVKIQKEPDAVVSINKMDTTVSITRKEAAEKKEKHCPNCGAPTGGGVCAYCNSKL